MKTETLFDRIGLYEKGVTYIAMWVNYEKECKLLTDQIVDDFLEQANTVIAQAKQEFVRGGECEKGLRAVIERTKENNTLENFRFIQNFQSNNKADKKIVASAECDIYGTLLKMSTLIIQRRLLDFIKLVNDQKFSHIKREREGERFILETTQLLQDFILSLLFELQSEIAEMYYEIKFSCLLDFLNEHNDDFFIEYREQDYAIGLTDTGKRNYLSDMRRMNPNLSKEQKAELDWLIEDPMRGLVLFQKEDAVANSEESNDLICNKYISDYKMLNKIATDNGFLLERVCGSHGIFKNESGKMIIIPQGRAIGKGLSLKIQRTVLLERE